MSRDVTWLHFSARGDFSLDRARRYALHRLDKPDGLWISPDGDANWRAWREAEDWGIPDVEYAYRVNLRPDANLLTLDGIGVGFLHERFPLDSDKPYYRDYPDFGAIMAECDGMLIPEYHWTWRHSRTWYYGWDCSSGCIWNLDAIASVELDRVLHRAQQEAVA